MTSNLRRIMIMGVGLASSLVLAGCAGSSSMEPGGQPPTMPKTSTGPEIINPKNAAALDVCGLLSSEAATKLGVKPGGEKNSNSLNPAVPDGCMWESPDGGGKKIGFTAIDGRSIKTYYKKSHSYTDFEKITVAGHPAVRANKTDPMTGGSCDIYLASKKNQVVYSYARTPKVGEVNPCDLSKQALELSVSSWPTAK